MWILLLPLSLLLLLANFAEGQTQMPQSQNGTSIVVDTNLTTNSNSSGIMHLKLGFLFCNGSSRMRTLYGFGQSAPAVMLAFNKAQQDGLLNLTRVNFTFTWYMDNCDQADAIGYGTQLILDDKIDTIIGPACLSSALIAGFLASYYSMPIYFWGATVSPDFSNSSTYPTVVNVNTDVGTLSQAIQSLLKMFEWTEIALIYTHDQERQMCNTFQSVFENVINNDPDLTIVYKQLMVPSEAGMKTTLSQAMTRARIMVTCFDKEVNRRLFLLAVYSSGLTTSNEYVFINPQLRSQGMLQQTTTTNGSMVYDKMWVDKNVPKDGRDDQAEAAARLMMVLDLENSSTQIDLFNQQMYGGFGQWPFLCDTDCMQDPSSPSQYARSLSDAIYLYAIALNRTIDQNGFSRGAARNASNLVNNSQGTFQGLTGKIVIDANGDRLPTFQLTSLNAAGNPTVFMTISVSNNTVTLEKNYSDPTSSIWATRGGKVPLFKPICGYTGTECPQNFTIYIVGGGGLILILLVGTILGIVLAIREKMKEQRRLARESLIPFVELKSMKEMKDDKAKSLRSMQSSQSGSTSKLTIDSKHVETDGHCYFVYDKQVVFGKKYIVRVRLDNDDLILFRKIRQLDHDNLNRLLGVCVDGPILMAVWKHCQRGSLKDVIAKEQYVADSFVIFALIRDLTNGLIALHQSFIGVHGHMTSENCLINDRWQLKLSDYGLSMIHESQPMLKRKLLWTAPELLREQNRLGSKPGDVYSFAVICSELINKETVWNGITREDEIEDVIYRLKRSNTAIPYRPQLNQREEVNQSIYHLIRDCWSENPANRPTMDMVRTILRQMIPNSNQNLMDYVFSMLEQYATSLEQEVEERTKELFEEKRKSDILLFRMLPRQVAEKLKLGEGVEPESFEQSTIFFSDVVSFTTLAGKCSPLQVVNLLNNLYTTFDNIIDSHDAYKVETIGDGYLVCSGIPKRNGNLHAKEIAELSFAFLRSVANFRIDHLPAERMNLRIGFHSGPAVAGVVGLTMPRYCLFGDAVNTASRMESSGRPGQIHISSSANLLLTRSIGGYVTEPRGETIIKGKGVMETFWLLGHQADVANSGPMYANYVGSPAETEEL